MEHVWVQDELFPVVLYTTFVGRGEEEVLEAKIIPAGAQVTLYITLVEAQVA